MRAIKLDQVIEGDCIENMRNLPDGMADLVNGNPKMYVPPGNAYVKSGQVVSVRFWVRVRAEDPENGYRDSRTYSYAGINFTPNDQYRRALVSRTVFLRNARSFTKS